MSSVFLKGNQNIFFDQSNCRIQRHYFSSYVCISLIICTELNIKGNSGVNHLIFHLLTNRTVELLKGIISWSNIRMILTFCIELNIPGSNNMIFKIFVFSPCSQPIKFHHLIKRSKNYLFLFFGQALSPSWIMVFKCGLAILKFQVGVVCHNALVYQITWFCKWLQVKMFE